MDTFITSPDLGANNMDFRWAIIRQAVFTAAQNPSLIFQALYQSLLFFFAYADSLHMIINICEARWLSVHG